MHRLRERLGGPLIDALAADFGGCGHRRMDFRRHAQHQLAGVGFLRGATELFASLQIILYGFLEGWRSSATDSP